MCWMNIRLSFMVSLFNLFFSSLPGLCLEKVPAVSPALSNRNTGSPASNRSTPDRDQEIITCYEKSGDIALLYLQEAEKVCVWECEAEELGSSSIVLVSGNVVPSWWECDKYSVNVTLLVRANKQMSSSVFEEQTEENTRQIKWFTL